jgi:hypothetical protein
VEGALASLLREHLLAAIAVVVVAAIAGVVFRRYCLFCPHCRRPVRRTRAWRRCPHCGRDYHDTLARMDR